MKNILVVVTDDAARTRASIDSILATVASQEVRVYLLSVQPKVTSHVAMFFGNAELLALHEKAGREALAPIENMLDIARVPYVSYVRVGRSAETIAQTARTLRCERVVCGPASGAGNASRIFGSVAQQVRQLMAGTRDCEVIGS